MAVRVLPFNDDRNDLENEGRSTAAFGVPMANLRFEPSAATLLGQAIMSELQAAGHTVTDHADGVQVTGAIMEFETHTGTTLLYWDVTDGFVRLRKGQAVLGIHTLAHVTGRSLDEVADAAIQSWEHQMQQVNVVRRVARQRVSLAGDLTAIAVVHQTTNPCPDRLPPNAL